MSTRFEWNEAAIAGLAREAVNEAAAELDRDFEQLRRKFTGHPVAEIKRALRRVFERRGGSISNRELDDYAQMISEGTKITFEPDL